MKPKSIVWFDWLFWTSIVLGLASVAYLWTSLTADLDADPDFAGFGLIAIIAILAVGNGISILLWFLISYRASNGARWVYTVLAGLGALGGVVDWETLPEEEIAINFALSAITVASIVLLFLPASSDWFRKGVVGGKDDIATFE